MRRPLVLAFLLLAATSLMVSSSSTAYTVFSGSNNCDQCHSGFDSYGSPTHQTHLASYSCNSCHGSSGDNPLISTCAVCHDANLLWNFHLQFAGNDLNGFDCATCHDVLPSEKDSWDSIKSRYRDAVVGR
jgi:hypothetical protein